VLAQLGDQRVGALERALERHERADRLPVSSSAWPITAASATFSCDTIADSISAVDSCGAAHVEHVVDAADDPEVVV